MDEFSLITLRDERRGRRAVTMEEGWKTGFITLC